MNNLESPFLEHEGVCVFHVYQGNGAPLGYWFSWEKTEYEGMDSPPGAQFDIRTLAGYEKFASRPGGPIVFTGSSVHEGPALWSVRRRDQQQCFFREFIHENIGASNAPWLPFVGQGRRAAAPTIEARYTPDRQAIKAAAKRADGIFQFLSSLVPDSAIKIPVEGFDAEAFPPIAPAQIENTWDDPNFQERLRHHVSRVRKWEKLLRPLIRRSECHYASDLPWWLSGGPPKAMEAIANPLPSIVSRRTPPTHLINEIRHTQLRRALLLRQARIDGKTIDRTRLWIRLNQTNDGIRYFAHYSAPRQEKRYHWEEVAASSNAESFIHEVLTQMSSTTTLVSVWGLNVESPPENHEVFAQLKAELEVAGYCGRLESM